MVPALGSCRLTTISALTVRLTTSPGASSCIDRDVFEHDAAELVDDLGIERSRWRIADVADTEIELHVAALPHRRALAVDLEIDPLVDRQIGPPARTKVDHPFRDALDLDVAVRGPGVLLAQRCGSVDADHI